METGISVAAREVRWHYQKFAQSSGHLVKNVNNLFSCLKRFVVVVDILILSAIINFRLHSFCICTISFVYTCEQQGNSYSSK